MAAAEEGSFESAEEEEMAEKEGSFQVAEGSLRVAAADDYKPAAAEVGGSTAAAEQGSQLAADAYNAYNSESDFTKSVLLQSIW